MSWEQIDNSIKFAVQFKQNKLGKTGLSDVVVYVYNPANTLVVDGESATELAMGIYGYVLDQSLVATVGEYYAVFHTDNTDVDDREIPSAWTVGRAGVEDLDALISSRADKLDYTAARALKLDYLDAPITSVAGPNGANAVVITINDGTNPLALARMQLYTDVSLTNRIAVSYANNSGTITWALDDGTYYLLATLGGYAFDNPITLTVDGDTVMTVSGSGFVAPVPSDPNLCNVYGYYVDPGGDPIVGATVSAIIAQPNVKTSGDEIVYRVWSQTITDNNGYWVIPLYRAVDLVPTTAHYIIEVNKEAPFAILVPDLSSANITTLLD